MTILPENPLNNLFENLVTQFVKDNIESIMRAEIQVFMTSEEAVHAKAATDTTREICTRNTATWRIWRSPATARVSSKSRCLSRNNAGTGGLRRR
ncbi:Transposase, Mutator family [Paenibacillus typhae]|uniref:Transposase, Mutator family n=1 Tax=Paenibacillus typhae TaxID=1174501 RepID=A0A1G8FAT5_9BACL|nr:hypothetical protein SAMN05216192_101187 [Paenibacillus typhae]